MLVYLFLFSQRMSRYQKSNDEIELMSASLRHMCLAEGPGGSMS
jgi:hypothetical protein